MKTVLTRSSRGSFDFLLPNLFDFPRSNVWYANFSHNHHIYFRSNLLAILILQIFQHAQIILLNRLLFRADDHPQAVKMKFLATSFLLVTLPFSLAAPKGGKPAAPDRADYKVISNIDFKNIGADREPSNKDFKMVIGRDGKTQYTGESPTNLRVDREKILHIIPHKPAEGYEESWTSGKIQTLKDQLNAKAGKKMLWEAKVKVGDAQAKNHQGVEQKIYLLGTDYRVDANPYPRMGELEILHLRNGNESFVPTLHCGEEIGGPCSEPGGYQPEGEPATFPLGDWARVGLEIDRSMCSNAESTSCWELETIKWSLNGRNYRTLTGREFGNQAAWNRLAHSKKFLTFAVTVGGDKGGVPVNKDTLDGDVVGMQVDWIRIYESK